MRFIISFIFILILTTNIFAQKQKQVSFECNDAELNKAFVWAKSTALSYAHGEADPVGFWYEAALPNREAFCMRDVSHQAIGAEILGLSKHNLNMFLKFAENISKEKDYCSYWEINRYNKPAPVDYENDKDFWYNLPANFDVIFNANRLYKWTGNKEYLNNPSFKKFYELSLNEYINHWKLGWEEVTERDRSLHVSEVDSRFGKRRGIPTYNEGGRAETLLGIDMTASIIAAYNAYSEILNSDGQDIEAYKYILKAAAELKFFDEFWWDKDKNVYRSIFYTDDTFDYFMVGENQAFLHYALYFDVISDAQKKASLIEKYASNYGKLIVELKSYLPIIFYENGLSDIATNMVKELCNEENKRRDYPENSFTIIEDFTRGLMGINADASKNTISTISRLSSTADWAEMKNIPIFSNTISVKHIGDTKTIFTNLNGQTLNWKAQIPGTHKFLFVNGKQTECSTDAGYSFCIIQVKEGQEIVVATQK
jgi:hypothetical protein